MLYKCHISIYILEKGIVKCEPLEKKTQNRLFDESSLIHKRGGGGGGGGGGGVNLTSYLDSLHKVSQYLLIHSKTLKARIKEIRGKNTKSAIL